MKKCFGFVIIMFLVCLLGVNVYAQQAPKGAKALFDSGEGTTVKMSSGPRVSAPTQAATPAKYVGISYKLVLLRPDGRFDIVPKSRIFRSGERLKLLVRTNKPGYLTILNIGTSGSTNVLHNDYVEAMSMIEIPRTGNFRFTGDPGTEKLLIMLSGSPNPLGSTQTTTVAQAPQGTLPPPPGPIADTSNLPPPPPPPVSGSPLPPPPPATTADASSLPPPPPVMLASIQGSKDIVLDDNQKTTYAVISPKNLSLIHISEHTRPY